MRKLLLFIFFYAHIIVLAQSITGKVINNSSPISGVTVVNMSSNAKTTTDANGNFKIEGNIGNEIRFIKNTYERASYVIQNPNTEAIINLERITEIEEVTIKKAPTGNLKNDSENVGESLSKKKLNSDLRSYYKTYSNAEVLNPKPGEFIQPVGPGFAFGDIKNKWNISDFAKWIRNSLTDDYFISLNLKPSEIDTFIYYSIKNFEKASILKYGYCSEKQLASLLVLFEKTILTFNKSSPN